MGKIAKKIAYFLSIAALLTTAFFAVPKCTEQTAYAQTTQTASGKRAEETTLISPSTYRQYLSLTHPMDVATCDDYMAIADKNRVYVYDVQDDEYRKYEHTLNQSDLTKNNIMQVQFYGGDLYFLDGTFLYRLDPERMERSDVSIGTEYPKFPCSSFLIVEDNLYYTNVKTTTAISCVTLDGSNEYTLIDGILGKPTIAFSNEEIYYTDAGKYLHKFNPRTKENKPVAAFPDELVSVQIQNDVLICTTLNGDFYAYTLAELASKYNAAAVTPLAHDRGDYTSLDLFGEYVYAVDGRSVRQYSLQTAAFTEFEICAASDSIHRLNGGAETLLSHGKLFMADNGNRRISVYDTKTETFCTPIPTDLSADFAPVYLAGDESTVLAADQTTAVLYATAEERYGEKLAAFTDFNGNLVGSANVYGKYYFVTDAGYYYVAEKQTNENAESAAQTWTIAEYEKPSTRPPALLTADAYGYLYVASGNALYRFSEEDFLSDAFAESAYATLPTSTQKIAVDYNGDVYALANGTLYKAGGEPYPLNEPLVYSESATIAAFAFGIEDNATYLLYEENYLAKTGVLNLPTVKNIPVNDVDESIFSQTPAAMEIVRLRPPAMVIDFTLNELSGAEVFPYENYSRRETPLTALKIGQTANGKHTILAFYDEQARAYRACLALTSDCLPLTDEEQAAHYVTYAQAKTMYATNEIPVYKFPHLSGLPTMTTLPRSTAISVLGECNDLDYSYYLVQYADGENVTYTGYVPKAYAVDFDPTPPAATTHDYGASESDKDTIQRLVFLLLGSAAIVILIDVLIFRAMRPKKDD